MQMLHSGISSLMIVQPQKKYNIHFNEGQHRPPPSCSENERDTVMAYTADNHALGFGIVARFHTVLENYKSASAKRKIYRRTVAELNELTNADLADIGISRSMIKRIAIEAANMS